MRSCKVSTESSCTVFTQFPLKVTCLITKYSWSSLSAGSAFMDSTNCGSKILKKGKTFRVFQNAKLEFATPWELLAYHLHRIYNYLHNTHIVLHCKQSRDDSKYQGGCAYGREPTSHGHREMTVALYIHFLYVFIHQLGCPF